MENEALRPSIRYTQAALLEKISKNWCGASYLILNFKLPADIRALAERELPAEWTKVMSEHVYAYVYDGKMPPEAIAQTVMNVSEDFMAGRPVALRAGDYIAVQKYLRASH